MSCMLVLQEIYLILLSNLRKTFPLTWKCGLQKVRWVVLIFSNFWINHVMQHSSKFSNAFQLFSMYYFSSYLFRINYITFFPFLVSWRLWIKESLKLFICYRRKCLLALVLLKYIFFEMIVYSVIIKESYFSSQKY